MNNPLNKNASDRLYQELIRIRFRVAQENGLPAWKVFSDKQLEEYVRILPRDKETFLKTSFSNLDRFSLFGKEICKAISDFIKIENNDFQGIIEDFDKILAKAVFIGEKKIFEKNEKIKDYASARKSSPGIGITHQGEYFSEKMQKKMIYDSELERKFMIMLEKSERVKYYASQPFHIRYGVSYHFGEKSSYDHKRYYPDFIVALDTGERLIIEMKNYFHLVDFRSKMKYELLKNLSLEFGYGFIISTNGKHTLEEAIDYPIDESFEKAILHKFETTKSLSYRDFLIIKNKFGVKNQLILPLAYKHDIFMANNILEKLRIHIIEIGKFYYTTSY